MLHFQENDKSATDSVNKRLDDMKVMLKQTNEKIQSLTAQLEQSKRKLKRKKTSTIHETDVVQDSVH